MCIRDRYYAMWVNIWCYTRYLPDPGHVILDTWHLTPTLDMLYLIYGLWHRYSVFTLAPAMLHLIYDLWLRHLVFTPALGIYTGTRYLTPIFALLYLTPIFAMLYLTPIFVMLYLTLILAMLYLSLDIRHRYLICRTWHLLLTQGIWYAFMWYKYLDLTSWLLTRH